MFLSERKLRDVFWENYNYRNRAIKYQFEAPLREGGVDLITIEKYQENYQVNSFEFKLHDIKKVILQAQENIPFSHKSWIVMPEEKKKILLDRYALNIKSLKHVGVILVSEGGRWEVLFQPRYHQHIQFHQSFVNLMML